MVPRDDPSQPYVVLDKDDPGILDRPGLFGFVFGLFAPALLPLKWAVGVGAAIGIGGYMSPEGSWFRNFSIGAGLGGLVYGAVQIGTTLAESGLAGLMDEGLQLGGVRPVAEWRSFGEVVLDLTLDVVTFGTFGEGPMSYIRHGI